MSLLSLLGLQKAPRVQIEINPDVRVCLTTLAAEVCDTDLWLVKQALNADGTLRSRPPDCRDNWHRRAWALWRLLAYYFEPVDAEVLECVPYITNALAVTDRDSDTITLLYALVEHVIFNVTTWGPDLCYGQGWYPEAYIKKRREGGKFGQPEEHEYKRWRR